LFSALIGCGDSNNYKSEYVYNFVASCSAQSSVSVKFCGCMMDSIMTQATEDEYIAIDLKMSTTGTMPDEMIGYATIAKKSCG